LNNKRNRICPEFTKIYLKGDYLNVLIIIIIIIIIKTIVTICNDRGVHSPGIWQDRRQANHQFSTNTLPGIAVYCHWPESFGNAQSLDTCYHLRM
jgi:hypothetical protein